MERDTKKSPLPVPATSKDGRPESEWVKRAQTAVEARTLGKKLRAGKRVLFRNRRHLMP